MQIAPHTKDEWITLALLPAKVFLGAITLLLVSRFPLQGVTPEAAKVLGVCFYSSVPFLLLGALVQSIFCRRGSALHTLLFLGFLSLSIMVGSWLGFGGFFIPLVCWGFWRFSHLVRRPEPTNKETPEQIECLDCHATIPVGESSCSKCGWTFKL